MNDKELREAVEVLKETIKEFGLLKSIFEDQIEVVLHRNDFHYPDMSKLQTLLSFCEQVLSAEMPTRATTLGAEDNKADINGWNACYDAFIAYLTHKKLGQEEKVKGLRNKIQAIVGNTFLTDQILKEIMEVV